MLKLHNLFLNLGEQPKTQTQQQLEALASFGPLTTRLATLKRLRCVHISSRFSLCIRLALCFQIIIVRFNMPALDLPHATEIAVDMHLLPMLVAPKLQSLSLRGVNGNSPALVPSLRSCKSADLAVHHGIERRAFSVRAARTWAADLEP